MYNNFNINLFYSGSKFFALWCIICRKEEDFWENRSHDDSEIETPSQSDYERPSYSLRVDESLFWENQHRDDDLESKTDYSQVDPCFRGDKKVRR